MSEKTGWGVFRPVRDFGLGLDAVEGAAGRVGEDYVMKSHGHRESPSLRAIVALGR